MKKLFLAFAVILAVAIPTAAQASNVSRANAVRMAKSYVQIQGFSAKGLADQLKFEGFSKADAAYGVSHAGANWMREAAQAAKSYLGVQAFSRTGLVQQLEFDGFTHSQASYGARTVGL